MLCSADALLMLQILMMVRMEGSAARGCAVPCCVAIRSATTVRKALECSPVTCYAVLRCAMLLGVIP
eukprot:8770246-Pyramimonas_sp.AAC.1